MLHQIYDDKRLNVD